MITLKQWMEVVNYRITEGSEFGWQCYGPKVYCLDSWDGDNLNGHSFTIIFDTESQEVYEVQAHDYKNNRAYRVINPEFQGAYEAESRTRGIYADEAWDEVNYIDLETDDDWLDKANAIFLGIDYDTRVSIPVEFTDEELLKYTIMAHEQDITLNQFIENALRAMIDEYQRDPESVQARADRWKAEYDLT